MSHIETEARLSDAKPTVPESLIDITQHEIQALKMQYNLADAHTHQSQSRTQREIVDSLPSLWYAAEDKTQYECEQEFIEAFYTLQGQHTALKRKNEIYLLYAASIGMHITATYLMQKRSRVGLIEPCFDNLHDLMKHMLVPMSPLDEALFHDATSIYDNLMKNALGLDAIFIVDPNNPTGFSLFADGVDGFLELVRFCKDCNKMLIMDLCFSSFIMASGGQRVDIYEILENSGVTYIAMEDTGKTWPIQDAKCSTLHTSKDINEEIYNIVTSVLLNVSPFVLNLVRSYVQDSAQDNFNSVGSLLDVNRKLAVEYLNGDVLRYCEPRIRTSVAWFEIVPPELDADEVQKLLLTKNVYVLSGKYFYWAHPAKGNRYIRVALARDTAIFEQAMKAASEVLNELIK